MNSSLETNSGLLLRTLAIATLAFAVVCAVAVAVTPRSQTAPPGERQAAPVDLAGVREDEPEPDSGELLASGRSPTPDTGPLPDAHATGAGTFTGTVYDAVTGQPLPAASVELTSSRLQMQANDAGRFGWRGLAGPLATLRASHDGYLPFADTYEVGPLGRSGTAVALSPPLEPGQLRIVLSWGGGTGDLDAHLWLPAAQPLHLFAQTAAPNGTPSEFPFAQLHTFHEQAPVETTTVSQFIPGEYVYAVHNPSAGGSFATSGARVAVYQERSLLAAFVAPPSASRWWHVFSIDGARRQLLPVNTAHNQPPGAYP